MSKHLSHLYILATKFYPFHTRCIVQLRCHQYFPHHFIQLKPSSNIQQLYSSRWFSKEVKTVTDASILRDSDGICWNCLKQLDKESLFFCANCKSVLPVDSSCDYFSLFDLKQDFKLSVTELQKKFKSLQRKLHPDKFSLKDPIEVAISETVSSLLNKAYFSLMKPLSRGLYMLELKGVTLEENASSDDTEFLMEIMELNEEVDEMDSQDKLQSVYDDLSNRVNTLTSEISDAFQRDDATTAKALLIKFKYYDNLLNQLKERLPPR